MGILARHLGQAISNKITHCTHVGGSRCGGLMVCVLDSRLTSLGLSRAQRHCELCSWVRHYSHSASFHQGVTQGHGPASEFNAVGNPAMDYSKYIPSSGE